MKEEITIYKRFFPKGNPMYETPYKNGKIHGLRKWWHDNGQLWDETPYVNGEVRGITKGWYNDGQLRYETSYKNNLQHGARINFKY